MIVYIKNKNIVKKSDGYWAGDYDQKIETPYTLSDKIIYEDGIKLYKESNQYNIDHNILSQEEIIKQKEDEIKRVNEQANNILTSFEKFKQADILFRSSHMN